MSNVVFRSWDRTESDDFKLNVENKLDKYTEAMPIRDPLTGDIVAWKVQPRYE